MTNNKITKMEDGPITRSEIVSYIKESSLILKRLSESLNVDGLKTQAGLLNAQVLAYDVVIDLINQIEVLD